MAGKTMVVTSGKGGVGKTTTVANLGTVLATKKYSVVMIDGDIGLRNLDVVMGLENRIVYNLVDIIEEKCRIQQAMIRDRKMNNLCIIPAAQTRDKSAVSPSDMIRLADELRPEFEWIVIDSPAGIERGFRNAIAPADRVLVVTNPEVSAVRDADRIIGMIEAEEKGPAQLIINRIKPEMVKRNEMLSVEDVLELLAIDLVGLVPEDERVINSTNTGVPIVIDGKNKAGVAFRDIAHRLLGEDIPFPNLEQETGLFARLSRWMRKEGGK